MRSNDSCTIAYFDGGDNVIEKIEVKPFVSDTQESAIRFKNDLYETIVAEKSVLMQSIVDGVKAVASTIVAISIAPFLPELTVAAIDGVLGSVGATASITAASFEVLGGLYNATNVVADIIPDIYSAVHGYFEAKNQYQQAISDDLKNIGSTLFGSTSYYSYIGNESSTGVDGVIFNNAFGMGEINYAANTECMNPVGYNMKIGIENDGIFYDLSNRDDLINEAKELLVIANEGKFDFLIFSGNDINQYFDNHSYADFRNWLERSGAVEVLNELERENAEYLKFIEGGYEIKVENMSQIETFCNAAENAFNTLGANGSISLFDRYSLNIGG